jgi:hypothetical protein
MKKKKKKKKTHSDGQGEGHPRAKPKSRRGEEKEREELRQQSARMLREQDGLRLNYTAPLKKSLQDLRNVASTVQPDK